MIKDLEEKWNEKGSISFGQDSDGFYGVVIDIDGFGRFHLLRWNSKKP